MGTMELFFVCVGVVCFSRNVIKAVEYFGMPHERNRY